MELARALGDPLRWRIVELLASEQLCVAHLAEDLATAQPLVSHHLKVLREAGLVDTDRYRYWTYYRLRPGALVRLAASLGLVADAAPSGTACRRQVPGADPTQPATARPAAPQGNRPMPSRDQPLDPISRQTFARSIESLHQEFRGIYSLETMGCGDACPIYPGKRYEDWELQDPAGQPVEVIRRIRDDIDTRVQQLLDELVPAGT